MPVSLAYTYSRGEFRSDFDSEDPIYGMVERGDELPYLPRQQLGGSVGIEVGRVSGFTALQYVARMRESAGSEPLAETVATDTQLTLDLGAALRITDFAELYADVRNLFEAQNVVARRPYGARPNAPRWFHAGVKLTL
jgi:Fe(3+) dicitrate transport protein